MKMDSTIFPMQGYWGKYLGGILCLVSLIGLGLISVGHQDTISLVISMEKQPSSLTLLFAAGLFIINFSKERVDDERVKIVRYTSLRAGFFIHFMMQLIFFFSRLLADEFDYVKIENNEISMYIFTLLIIPQVTYFLVFQIGMRLDPSWIYTDKSAEENWGSNPVLKYFNIILIVLGIAVLVFTLFSKV